MPNDNTQNIQSLVTQAVQQTKPVSISASGSHNFMLPGYAEDVSIDMTGHHGIIDYQPTELTLKARSGTTLTELKKVLSEQQQRLATDFPAYSTAATLGGAISIGHTGSGRPYLGAVRDHILGAGLINGLAQQLNCGGQVMKNVAGYDISRLLAGSRGTLGVILDITLKVLPVAERQHTLVFEMEENQAIQSMNKMAGLSLPITASVFFNNRLYTRLEGTDAGLNQALKTMGGDALTDSSTFWQSIQQQTHDYFGSDQSLWRIIVPSTTPQLELEFQHQSMIDWCGGLRWIHASEITQSDFIHISNMGGYIESHRSDTPTNPAHLMSPLQCQMHAKIKRAFDPNMLFNPKLSAFDDSSE